MSMESSPPSAPGCAGTFVPPPPAPARTGASASGARRPARLPFLDFVAGISSFPPAAPSESKRSSVASSLPRRVFASVIVVIRQLPVVAVHSLPIIDRQPPITVHRSLVCIHPFTGHWSRSSDVGFDRIALFLHPRAALLRLLARHQHVEEAEGLVAVLDA